MIRLTKITIVFTVLILAGCEDFLDLQPVSEIGEGNFYRTQEEIEKVLVGCYTSMQETVAHECFCKIPTTHIPYCGSEELSKCMKMDYSFTIFHSFIKFWNLFDC